VKRLCHILDVNRSSYYKWLASAEARAACRHEDRVLAEEIREVHSQSGGAYGSPRVTAELRGKGGGSTKSGSPGSCGRSPSPESSCADACAPPSRTRPPHRLRTCSSGTSPPPNWGRNITYLPLENGEFLYLATVLDCFSRKVVGWSITGHMRTSTVADALRMAALTRGRLDDAVFHSYHGAQAPGPSPTSATGSG